MLYSSRNLFLLFFVALFHVIPLPSSISADELVRHCSDEYVHEALIRANTIRAQHKLVSLSTDGALTNAARRRAVNMAYEQHLSHDGWQAAVRWSGFGKSPAVGENIAMGYPTAEKVVNGWYESPGHRKNLIRATFTRSGLACVIGKQGRRWWVHILGAEPKI